jgi:hypothetical protein
MCEVAASLDIPAVTFIKGTGSCQLLWVVEFSYTLTGSHEIQPVKRHLRGGENAVSGTAGQDNRDSRDTQPYFTSLSTTSPTYVSYTGRTQGDTPINLANKIIYFIRCTISHYLSQNAVDFVILSFPVHVTFTCLMKHAEMFKYLSHRSKDYALEP